MKIINKNSIDKTTIGKTIFLAGPSYRSEADISGWRKEAVNLFESIKFDGTLYIPEPLVGISQEYATLCEDTWMSECDIILFWIPRKMLDLPGLTTNIEFGMYMNSGKIVVGYPTDADHMEYIQMRCDQLKIPITNELTELVSISVNY